MTVTDAVKVHWQPSAALREADPQLADLLSAEAERRATSLQLLAGENVATEAVLAALAGPLVDKYAEGYPGHRHHTGCGPADATELLAVERAQRLFSAEHANVQPRSGTSAMLAAYAALLRPGDTVLAMSLEHGGHLSAGSRANFSGRWFEFIGYGVREEDGLVDLDQVRELAKVHRPKAIIAGSISYPRHLDWAAFREIADEVDAYLIATAAQTIGLVAGERRPRRCRTRTSRWPPPTSCCADRAAGCCSAAPSSPTGWTARSSRSPRVARP